MASGKGTRSRSVADPVRFTATELDFQEKLDEEEGEGEDPFCNSQTYVPSYLPSKSSSGHAILRHKVVSVDEDHEFRRRTRVIKGRPDFLQRLDGTEWKEIESVRMDDHTYISRHQYKRPSLQMVRIDPSLNLSATVDNATFKARLGLLASRAGRSPNESSDQPPQSEVAWFGLTVTESAAGPGGALCMRVPYAENLLVSDIWRCVAMAMSESVEELQSRCIMTYSLPSSDTEGTRKYQLVKQTQFLFQTHLFSYLERNLHQVKDIPIVIEGVPGVGPEDEAQSARINRILGSKFSAALQPEDYGSEDYRHTQRDEVLARRTMRSYVMELVDQRCVSPMDYALSMDIDRSDPCEGIIFKIPPSGKIDVCFHRGSQEVQKAVAVHLGVTEIMTRVLPLLYANKMKTGNKPTAYNVDYDSRIKQSCFQVCGEEEFLAGDTPLLDFAVIRRLVFQERAIHLALVKKPDPQDDRVTESTVRWPRVDPHVHDVIDDSALVRITNSSSKYQELKAVSAWNCEERLSVTLEGLKMADMNQLGKRGIKAETLISIQLSLYYGEKCIRGNQLTTPKKLGPVGSVIWNERLWIAPNIKIKDLPKETKVLIEVMEVIKRRGSIGEASDSCLYWGLLGLVDSHDNTLREGKQVVYLWPNQSSAESSCPDPHSSRAILPADGNPSSRAVKVSLMLDSRAVPAIFPEGVPATFRRGTKAGSVKSALASMTDRLSAQALPAILDNLTWASKDEVGAVHQVVCTRRKRKDLPLEMAFKLLDSMHADTELRQLAVDCLAELPVCELRLYVLQLVQALKYEWRHDSPLARLLLATALANKHFGNLLFWCVRSELGDSVYHTRYSVLLEAYLWGCGEIMMTMFERQMEVHAKLNAVRSELLESEAQKEGHPGTLQQVMAKAGLDRMHFHPPYNQQVCVGQMDLSAAKVLSSKKRPIWLECRNMDPMVLPSQATHKMLVKHGDDLRQDMLILHALRLMEKIWQDDNLHLCLTPYGCAATGNEVGMIEVVLGAETLATVSSEVMNEKALYEWLQIHHKGPSGLVDSDKMHAATITFSKSLAGYSVATFILGLTDRHNDNIMIMKEGNILHIDYGHILGNFKKFIGVKREWCPFILTPDFVYLMGGKNGHYFTTYKNLCVRAFLSLRKRADLIINLFELMRHANLPELSSRDDVRYLRDNLFLGLSEGEAKEAFLGEIDKCMKRNWTVLLNWWTHLKRHSPAST